MQVSWKDLLEAMGNVLAGHDQRDKRVWGEKGRLYKWIPLDFETFWDELKIAISHAHSPIHFVDAGCGIGDKLYLAMAEPSINQVTGIELNADYLKTAEKFLAFGIWSFDAKFDLRCEDIRQVNYSKYNLVYFYNPIANEEMEREFETRVAKTVKPGTVIMAHSFRRGPFDTPKFKRVHNQIYVRREGE